MSECATESCGSPAIARFERAGVGSEYCDACMRKIEALRLRGKRTYYPDMSGIKAIDDFECPPTDPIQKPEEAKQ